MRSSSAPARSGLFQVFELGLLEIKAHIIDSLAYPGGQCIELYPDKPIYDIPAVPVCTGQGADRQPAQADRAVRRDLPPRPGSQRRSQKQDDGRFFVETSKGTRFLTKTIFIAGGVGSFQPRTLKVDGLDKFDGTQLLLPRARTRRSSPARTSSSSAAATRRSTGR